MKRIGFCLAILTSASLSVAAPVAHADNSSEFLALIARDGMDVGPTKADVLLALADAENVCFLFKYGYSTDDARRATSYSRPTATPEQVANFVEAARAKICPQALTPLQPGGDF